MLPADVYAGVPLKLSLPAAIFDIAAVVAEAVSVTLPPLHIVDVEGVTDIPVGADMMVNSFVDTALPQGELPDAVKVMVTLPEEISAALGL